MNYTIEKITTLIGARRIGTSDAQIGWLLTDSRSLCFPEETLFFALKTPRNDGHHYISDLYRRGITSVMVEGGASILRQFINAGCWNEARIEISPVVLSKGIKAPEVGMRNAIPMHLDGNDILVLKNVTDNCKLATQ